MKNSLIKTISYIAVLLVISLVIGFVIFLTNGFKEIFLPEKVKNGFV